MPFVPAPNIVMAEIRAVKAAQQIENRIMVNVGATPTPTLIEGVAEAVSDWAVDSYFPFVTSTVSLTEVVATDLTTQNGGQFTALPVEPTAGGLGNNPMPNETAFCVSLRSASRGRSARGRFYAFGLDKGIVTENTVTDAYRNNITGAVQDLIDMIDGLGWTLVIVSYRTNNAPRVGGPVYFPVTTAVSVDNVVDSMRRRKPGVGT